MNKVSAQINQHSSYSVDVVSDYRSSLKDSIAQATAVLTSLDDFHEADEIVAVESIYRDSSYRSNYYRSINKVEFDDEYEPDLEGNFTVDDLLLICAPTRGIFDQLHNFTVFRIRRFRKQI